MKTVTGVLTAALIMLLTLTLSAQGAEPNYVGAGKCKICHMSKKKGAQYGAWQASKHSKAFEVLGTPAAKEAAVKAGVKGNPQEAAECLKCHVTGSDAPAERKTGKYKVADGVTCESCHGPGENYASMKVMRNREASTAAGLKMPTVETCLSCHNEKSPTFKDFNCTERWAKIVHDNPATEGGGTLPGCK